VTRGSAVFGERLVAPVEELLADGASEAEAADNLGLNTRVVPALTDSGDAKRLGDLFPASAWRIAAAIWTGDAAAALNRDGGSTTASLVRPHRLYNQRPRRNDEAKRLAELKHLPVKGRRHEQDRRTLGCGVSMAQSVTAK
jgi:hypothetical protein